MEINDTCVKSGTGRKSGKIFYCFLLLAYSILVMWGIAHHEPWRDEAYVWLVSKCNVTDIICEARYAGTPVLWYLLVHTLVLLNLGYKSMFILHGIVAIVCVGLFLFYSPFSNFTKIVFIFCYHMAYEYAVISRNYNITILLLFLIAVFYKERFRRPLLYSILVFMLFNTNVHSIFTAGYLFLLYAFELFQNDREKNFKKYLPLLIMFTGALASLLQLIPPGDSSVKAGQNITPDAFFAAMATAVTIWWLPMNKGAMVVSGIILITIIFSYFLKKPKILLLIIFSYGWLFYVFTFVVKGALRHHGLLLIFLIFALWLDSYYEEIDFKKFNNKLLKKSVAFISTLCEKLKLTGARCRRFSILLLNINLLLSCFCTASYYYFEYEYSFSGSKEVAEFMIKNNYEDYIIVGHLSSKANSLLPYLPEAKLWYPDLQKYGTFIDSTDEYIEKRAELTNMKVLERINENFPDKSRLLLLLSESPLDYPERYGYSLIFENKNLVFRTDEIYWLYKPVE